MLNANLHIRTEEKKDLIIEVDSYEVHGGYNNVIRIGESGEGEFTIFCKDKTQLQEIITELYEQVTAL